MTIGLSTRRDYLVSLLALSAPPRAWQAVIEVRERNVAESLPKGPRRRLLELDSLRGLAALSVVLYHYTFMYGKLFGHGEAPLFSFPKGQLGVKLFIIISGFVILMTISRTKTVMDFVVSRFSRIYPAYWAAVIFTFCVLTATKMWPEGRVGGMSAVLNLTMLQEFVHIKNVDGVYWTLQYELVFYGLALALFVFGMLRRVELVSAGLLCLSILYWFALRENAFARFGPAGEMIKWGLILLLIFQNIQFFVTGMMLYRCWQKRLTPNRAAIIAMSILTTLIVQGPFLAALHAIFAIVIALAVMGRLGVLRSAPLVFLGSISYTLYLTHQNAGYVVLHALETRGINANIAILTTVLAAVAFASLMSAYIEQPAMRFIRSRYATIKAWRLSVGQKTASMPAD